jgi:tRNA pseudouridine13 synthase
MESATSWIEPFITDPVESQPFVTTGLPGIGGEIKAVPAFFVVDEIPLYEPIGEGEHVYVRLTREGLTTRSLQKQLADLFDLREVDVGCAGLKDKHARVTQTFSLLLESTNEATVGRRIREALPVKVAWVRRHRNKLKTGHLLGNRFRVVVLHPEADAMARAEAIAEALRVRGVSNFYGAQRFGINADNALRGREALLGRGPREPWLRRFLLSAYQAALFNAWLAERIRRGWFDRLLTGDVAKKTDTGGLFEVSDAKIEQSRFQRDEITYTGPIYGRRIRWARGQPGDLEREVLEAAGVTSEMLRRARLRGSRRVARFFPWNLGVEPHTDGLTFTLSLPKGAYATTVLREFIKATTMALPEE